MNSEAAKRGTEAMSADAENNPTLDVKDVFRRLNQTARAYPSDQTFHSLFERQALANETAIAVFANGETVDYQTLNARANELAHQLIAMEVRPGTLVGICIERSPEMIVAMLGVLKAGAAYVPLDPSYPIERLSFMLEDARVHVLLTTSDLRMQFQGIKCPSLCLDSDREIISRNDSSNPDVQMSSMDPAYVIYTSGSTGIPKGVQIRHRGLVNYVTWAVDEYRVADGCGAPVHSSISFDLTITSLFLPLLAGKTVFLLSNGVESLAEALLERDNYSLIKITPAHLRVLVELLPVNEIAGRVRAVIIGGEALHFENLAFWRRNAPATRLINEYGPTETVVGCCVYEVDSTDAAIGRVPIGQPIANAQLYVVDQNGELVAPGTAGELLIGGDGVAANYLNRDTLTAQQFIADAYGEDSKRVLYRSGDEVRILPDGNLEFLGRIDDQVKIKGFRVEPREIERALADHSAIVECAVIAADDERGDKRLVACVVAVGSAPETRELKDFLVTKLPEHMIPSTFIFMKELPLTVNGKLDRDALPREVRADSTQEFVGARSAVEETLTRIWSDVFKLQRVSVNDNFFDLGGDSILGTLILARAAHAGVKLSPRQLFAHQTIAALSLAVGESI